MKPLGKLSRRSQKRHAKFLTQVHKTGGVFVRGGDNFRMARRLSRAHKVAVFVSKSSFWGPWSFRELLVLPYGKTDPQHRPRVR